jgi:outer membrane receptor protein involved in Fe transport
MRAFVLNRTAFVAILIALGTSSASLCQSGQGGSVGGTATDPSGTAVAFAKVTLRNLNTSFRASTETNDHGLFRFPLLPVGPYQLLAECPGFNKVQIERFELTVGAYLSLTIHFALAVRKESVTVVRPDSIADASRAVDTTIDNRLLSTLPANGRDFSTYALLAPGVTQDVRGGLSFTGQRAMNSLLLDGMNNDDNFWGQPIGATGFIQDGRQPYYISQDAVQEFQIASSSYSSELGRAGGGIINTVTKSGSNDFHGSGFWFYRDKGLNANDPVNKRFGLPKSPFHFNQFGGTFGGPIAKDRVFFFGNYEGMRSNVPNPVFLNLPGGFAISTDSTIARFQNAALDYLRPRAMSWVWPVTQNDYLGKLDSQISRRSRLSATALFQRFAGGGALDLGAQNAFEHTSSTPVRTGMAMVSLLSSLSDRTLNDARFAYVHTSLGFTSVSSTPEANIFEQNELVLTVGGDSASPQTVSINQAQWSDVLNHQKGDHGLKIGGDVLVSRIGFFVGSRFSGVYDFSSLESFGRNLVGQPQPSSGDDYLQAFSSAGTAGVLTHPNFASVAAFAEDEWRALPSLTLNLGLRYDLQAITPPPITNPSPDLLKAGFRTSALPTDTRNFAPRIGLAWSPAQSGHLVVHAGYGIFYAVTPSALTSRAHFQNGITVQTRTFFGDDPETAALIPRYPNNFCGAPNSAGIPPSCPPPGPGASTPTLQMFSARYRQPYVQQGDLSVELQGRTGFTFLMGYLISKGTRLQQIRDANLGGTRPATILLADSGAISSYEVYASQRPLPEFHRILLFNSDANSIYHGLTLRLNKRFSRRAQWLASYTFSKVIDDNPNVYALNPGAGNDGLVQYPGAPNLDRGLGNDDQRHRFTLGGVWDLSYADHLPRALKGLFSGWELSGTVIAQSGQPYSGLLNFDLNHDGDFATDRAPGAGRNTFHLPASVSLNPRVTRSIPLREHATLQIMGEAFNALNHPNIVAANTNQYAVSTCGVSQQPCLVPQKQGLTAFATPAASSGARVVQAAVKLVF